MSIYIPVSTHKAALTQNVGQDIHSPVHPKDDFRVECAASFFVQRPVDRHLGSTPEGVEKARCDHCRGGKERDGIKRLLKGRHGRRKQSKVECDDGQLRQIDSGVVEVVASKLDLIAELAVSVFSVIQGARYLLEGDSLSI